MALPYASTALPDASTTLPDVSMALPEASQPTLIHPTAHFAHASHSVRSPARPSCTRTALTRTDT